MDSQERKLSGLEKELNELQDKADTKAGELSFAEYQVLATRTYPDIFQSQPMNLAHMAMGMTSEISELLDAYEKRGKDPFAIEPEVNVSEELADIAWYLANWCTIRGYQLERLQLYTVTDQMNNTLIWQVCETSDLAKKLFAYGKPINPDKEIELLAGVFRQLQSEFGDLESITFKRALFNNIAKLTVRYPNKFDKDLAQNRDLAAEYEVLKKGIHE